MKAPKMTLTFETENGIETTEMLGSKTLDEVFEKIEKLTSLSAAIMFEIVRVYCDERRIDLESFAKNEKEKFIGLLNGNSEIVSKITKQKLMMAVKEVSKTQNEFDA